MRKFSRAAVIAAFAVTALAGCAVSGTNTESAQTEASPVTTQPAANPVTTSSGLRTIDTVVGTGASPRPNQTAVVHYTGWLYVNGAKGKKFDSSLDNGRPFEFPVGAGRVIKGWDEGVATMKVGGKRTLIVPPNLGYGATGAGSSIPPNATLMFDVELLGLK
jgi:peptidylprolyl isomerase